MIVKDEARSIRATIESVAKSVDRCLIIDTGSSDGTVRIAHETCDRLFPSRYESPFVITSAPFVDFATTRNLALDRAAQLGATFGLVLSGDETLVFDDHHDSLRPFCEAHYSDTRGAYNIPIQYGGITFDSPRLVRFDAGWRYVGAVHEVLMKDGEPPPSIRVPGCHIFHDAENADPEKKNSRLYRDLELLRNQLKKNPTDTRTWFYVAQTLEDLGLRAQAIEAYARRVELGGWVEERYEALYRIARNSMILGKPWSEVQQLYLDAHATDPRRAEPLFEIAQHYKLVGNHALCWLFASRGAQIPYPKDCKLFIQQDVYRWKLADLAGISGYYVGEYDAGDRFARQAFNALPQSDRLRENVAIYERKSK